MKNEKSNTRILLINADKRRDQSGRSYVGSRHSEVVRNPMLPTRRARMRTNPMDAIEAMSGRSGQMKFAFLSDEINLISANMITIVEKAMDRYVKPICGSDRCS